MISTRVLEILRMPDSIVADDITLLEKEIKSYPYVQSLRALHLLGVHKYDPESFQKVLSETAAYTTDKKILYQLINKKPLLPVPVPFVEEIEQVKEFESDPEDATHELTEAVDEELGKTVGEEETENDVDDTEKVHETEEVEINTDVIADVDSQFKPENLEEIPTSETIHEEVLIDDVETIAEVENNLNEETEILDVESTVDIHVEIENAESKEELSSDISENTVEEAELSFHAMDEFLPNVKIEAHHSTEYESSVISQAGESLLSPEEEMKKLIEAVEQKMKESKKEVDVEDETPDYLSQEINFAEGYLEPDPIESISVDKEKIDTKANIDEEVENSTEIEKSNAWKPLVIESALPDALLNKDRDKTSGIKTSAELQTNDALVASKEVELAEQVIIKENTEIVIQQPKDEEYQEDLAPLPSPSLSEVPQFSSVISSVKPSDSNVPNFINTWQNWLKIDRVEPTAVDQDEKVVEEIKNQAIETFIENEPRISQLKDEVTFVVKEKSDDISHLMTETLARLYIEQKLYTKAIKSFKILIDKHPEKEAYFKEVIKEIKGMRPRF